MNYNPHPNPISDEKTDFVGVTCDCITDFLFKKPQLGQ